MAVRFRLRLELRFRLHADEIYMGTKPRLSIGPSSVGAGIRTRKLGIPNNREMHQTIGHPPYKLYKKYN